MESWPPLARKGAALAILAALMFGLVAYLAIPAFGFVSARLDDLEQSRFELARLEARAARAPLPKADRIPTGIMIVAANKDAAGAQLQAHVSSLAAKSLVELSAVQALAVDGDAAVAVRFTAIGDEASLRAFVWALETGKPFARLSSWRWNAGEGVAALQLEATAMAAWRRP
jgi:hypothetical protein